MRVKNKFSKDPLWREKNLAKLLKKNKLSTDASREEINDLLLKTIADPKNMMWSSECITKEQLNDPQFLSKLYDIYSEKRILMHYDAFSLEPDPKIANVDLLIKYIYLKFPDLPNITDTPLNGIALGHILGNNFNKYIHLIATTEFAQRVFEKDHRSNVLEILNISILKGLKEENKEEYSPDKIEKFSIKLTSKLVSKLPKSMLIEQLYYNHENALKYISKSHEDYRDFSNFATIMKKKRKEEEKIEHEYEGDRTYIYVYPPNKRDPKEIQEEFNKIIYKYHDYEL